MTDSEENRKSAANVPFGSAPNITPDGTIDAEDRRTLAGDYAFAAAAAGGSTTGIGGPLMMGVG
jgi:hypothetical protein